VAPSARTPEEAVDFLRVADSDVRASVVLNGDGEIAAHSEDEGRGERMRDLVVSLFDRAAEAAGAAVDQLEVSTPAGSVFAMRRSRFSVAVVTDRFALSSLVMLDLRRILLDLEAAGA